MMQKKGSVSKWLWRDVPFSFTPRVKVLELLEQNKRLKAQLSHLRDEVRSRGDTEGPSSLGHIRDFSDREIYQRYFELSSDCDEVEEIETQSIVAKAVWETGGSIGGYVHKKSHSHWRDSEVFSERFEAWGQSCLRTIEGHPLFDSSKLDQKVGEYGSGGGAVLNALDAFASELHGFDIAQTNLDECQRVVGSKFRPHLVANDLSNLADLDLQLDVFVSFNVFQHLPSRAYVIRVVRHMHRMLRDGGSLIVDIRIDNGNPRFVGYGLADYDSLAGHTFANIIRIDLFWKLLEQAGFRVEKIGKIADKNNMATFWATKVSA